MNAETREIAKGLRATIKQLERLKRHDPRRIYELTARQELLREKIRGLETGERAA